MSKRAINLIVKEGTPKQKAILISKGYFEALRHNKKPISEEDYENIKKSINSKSDVKEYNKWIKYYYIYCDYMNTFGVCWREYQFYASKLIETLRIYDSYIREELHLNTIVNELIKRDNKEAIDVIYSSIKSFYYNIDSKGEIYISKHNLKGILTTQIEEVNIAYYTLKASIDALEEWEEENKEVIDIKPEFIVEAIEEAKISPIPADLCNILGEIDEKLISYENIKKDTEYKKWYENFIGVIKNIKEGYRL